MDDKGKIMTSTTALFFYGTLRAAEVRQAVLGTDLPSDQLQQAMLSGYEVRRVDGALYPMLVARSDGQVNGLLATGLDVTSLCKLDQFEGVHYRRTSLEVNTVNGPIEADVYLPDQLMVAAELWYFDSWYKRDMTSFLEREFNLDGVRPPVR